MSESLRPTKKQKELLSFIEKFIIEHGYSPSYREIMTGLDYNSVATVSLHVSNLIKRGQLKKRDYSARSLEVVEGSEKPKIVSNQVNPNEERWLVEKVEFFFVQAEQSLNPRPEQVNQLSTLIASLRILGMTPAAEVFSARLMRMKKVP